VVRPSLLLDPRPVHLVSPPEREEHVVFLSAVRTGFGAFGGALRDHSATDLGALAAQCAVARAGVAPADLGHVVFGNVVQTSTDAAYFARHVGLRAGLPIEVPAVTVNRLCGSGFEAVIQAAHRILLGEAAVVLAGGAESMSQAPYVVRGARWGTKLGQPPALEDSLWDSLRDTQCGLPMGETAENLGRRYEVTREDADAYALASQRRAKIAWDAGAFRDEVVPVPLRAPRTKQTVEWAMDEHMRPETTPDALAKLPPVFRKDGLVTAGNASGVSDGAAALVVAGERWARGRELRPLGRVVSWAVTGVDPALMGIGPAPAARAALAGAGLALEQMDLVEVNEAFAAQYVAVERELGLDRERTNVDGGAIAIGHPLGASGARITAHLLHALRRRNGRFGLGSACIGGGQGIAVVIESLPA
jgi:acetyl-CoA acyltransferase 2